MIRNNVNLQIFEFRIACQFNKHSNFWIAVVKVIDFSKFTDEVCILLLEASLPLHIERNVGNAHIKIR